VHQTGDLFALNDMIDAVLLEAISYAMKAVK